MVRTGAFASGAIECEDGREEVWPLMTMAPVEGGSE